MRSTKALPGSWQCCLCCLSLQELYLRTGWDNAPSKGEPLVMHWSRWNCPKRRDEFKIQPAFIWPCKGKKDFQREKILKMAYHILLLAVIQVIWVNWGKVMILMKDCCPLQKIGFFSFLESHMQSSALTWPRCSGLIVNFMVKSLVKATPLPNDFQMNTTIMLRISFFLPFFPSFSSFINPQGFFTH